MSSSIVIIGNPVSRQASPEKFRAVTSFFEGKGHSTELLITRKRGDAEEFARQAAARHPDMLISAGGDGTINEVVNGLAGSGVPLAIIPLGTTNVLAREIFPHRTFSEVLEVIAGGRPRNVSLGRIEHRSGERQESRLFCLMAGIGFDGQAVRDVNLRLKGYTGPGAYVLSGLKTLARYAPPEIVLRVDGQEISGYAAIIGNISRYGGDFRVTPDARIDDPQLYACVFRGKRRLDLLRYVLMLPFGRHIKAPDVTYVRAKEIVVRGSAPMQIDGDYLGSSPAVITVSPDPLRLIY
ncbi:MAG: diacylglycerol kinase family lipid kinase [Nitrospirae bacterium]|nr:MAG: diacylglycerol kinase family lipid kinase [Nitrospirota bacterium]